MRFLCECLALTRATGIVDLNQVFLPIRRIKMAPGRPEMKSIRGWIDPIQPIWVDPD